MQFPFPGIGVVFDINALPGSYGAAAWRVFMKRLDPKRLIACILVDGDTSATLRREADEYCIGIYGPTLDLDYVRDSFENADDVGLAPMHRRFIEKVVLDHQPLPIAGNIDAFGRFASEEWMRERCKAAGWVYAPKAY